MFTWEAGVLAALVLWLFLLIALLVALNSTLARNLGKVGLRISWSTQSPCAIGPTYLTRPIWLKVLAFVGMQAVSLLLVLLSWFYVFATIGMWLHLKAKDRGVPETVRNARWKLKNWEMSTDQVLNEIAQICGNQPGDLEAFKAEVIQDLKNRGIVESWR